IVGKTFSRRPANDFRSKGFSVANICATVFLLRKTLFAVLLVSSLASERQRLMLSGLMPTSVPVQIFPVVVATIIVLSTNAAISVKYFLCANDNFLTPSDSYEIVLRLFIFDLREREEFVFSYTHRAFLFILLQEGNRLRRQISLHNVVRTYPALYAHTHPGHQKCVYTRLHFIAENR